MVSPSLWLLDMGHQETTHYRFLMNGYNIWKEGSKVCDLLKEIILFVDMSILLACLSVLCAFSARGDQKQALDPLELELKTVDSSSDGGITLPGSKSESRGRPASDLNHWAIHPAQVCDFY